MRELIGFILLVVLLMLQYDHVNAWNGKFKSNSVSSINTRRKELVNMIKKQDKRRNNNQLNDAIVEELESLNPTLNPGALSSFEKYSKGLWSVVYAPHISTIERLIGIEFDVFYLLDGKGNAISNVKFKSKLLKLEGWLNVKGSYGSIDDHVCSVEWDHVWCDFEKESPSQFNEIERHWIPVFIQTVGASLFIEAVSKFPVYYVDESICIFEFSLLGTKIVTKKVNNADVDQVLSMN